MLYWYRRLAGRHEADTPGVGGLLPATSLPDYLNRANGGDGPWIGSKLAFRGFVLAPDTDRRKQNQLLPETCRVDLKVMTF